MFRKKDWLIIAAVLLLAGGIALWQYLQLQNTAATDLVRIWVNGKVHSEYSLGLNQDVTVKQDNGCENVIHIGENGFFMLRSNCPNQLCIEQGEVTKDNYIHRHQGHHVICLPNRVDVELVLKDKPSSPSPEMMDSMDIPDI
ncbi:MAG: NusG domain II-containing protein [Clostridia bacterium]|nr:NusG domain II-containing protein [Clostridia bacterium]MBR2053791.1 NusG domain II-containing protein [Clostridia bacterium]MBR6753457.1 NusG domain II-containing protein [Clostridia bacterium]